MSLLTPGKIPVGFALSQSRVTPNLASEKQQFRRFGRISSSKKALWLLALQFVPALLAKTPIVLETEELGPKKFHEKIILLVNCHTASAAEMIVAFARENNLPRMVGEKTAGRLLSARSVKVGQGYRLALPTGAYYTWRGSILEGHPPIRINRLSSIGRKEEMVLTVSSNGPWIESALRALSQLVKSETKGHLALVPSSP